MSLKFLHVQIGQSFWFEGATFVKTNALMARNQSTGKERLVPRSAVVELSPDIKSPQVPLPPKPVDPKEVSRALDRFEAQCAAALLEIGHSLGEDSRSRIVRAIRSAREECDRTLGLTRPTEN